MNFAYWSSCVFTDSSTRAWIVTDFGCLGGALMIAMLSLCSSLTVLRYVLSYKGSDSLPLRGSSGISRLAPAKHAANESPVQLVGWSDRHGFRGNEVGSLPPVRVSCPRADSLPSLYPSAYFSSACRAFPSKAGLKAEPKVRFTLSVNEFSAKRHFPPRRQPAKFLGDSASRDLAVQPLAISNVGQSIIESFRGFIQEFDLFGAQLFVLLGFPEMPVVEIAQAFHPRIGIRRARGHRQKQLPSRCEVPGTRRDVDKIHLRHSRKQTVICEQMCLETGETEEPRIHKTEGNHRGRR